MDIKNKVFEKKLFMILTSKLKKGFAKLTGLIVFVLVQKRKRENNSSFGAI